MTQGVIDLRGSAPTVIEEAPPIVDVRRLLDKIEHKIEVYVGGVLRMTRFPRGDRDRLPEETIAGWLDVARLLDLDMIDAAVALAKTLDISKSSHLGARDPDGPVVDHTALALPIIRRLEAALEGRRPS